MSISGCELQTRRQALGKTQVELGIETGLRQELVSRLERGRLPDVSVSKLLVLASALGLELTLTPMSPQRPTLESLLDERRHWADTGPSAR